MRRDSYNSDCKKMQMLENKYEHHRQKYLATNKEIFNTVRLKILNRQSKLRRIWIRNWRF